MEQKFITKSILSAAEQGLKSELQSYISRGVVSVVDEEGSTPLIYAAANGREEIVRLLLDKKTIASNKLEYNTDVKYCDQQNIYGWTALMQAACYGHMNVVISLIQRGANVNIQNTWGASALVGASQGGFYGVVHKLLNVGAEANPDISTGGMATLTPLMAATQCGHVEIVQELLRRGADVGTCLKGTQWTALMLAALNNQLPVMELLLQHGADKKATDINGQTAADLAAALGHTDMVRLLTGKKPKECSEGEFFDKVKSGDIERVRVVLETQKQLANSRDKDGATPLMLAANRGNIKMVELLLDRGAGANTTDDKYGWTALMLATHQRKYEVVQLLGEKGADVSVRGKSGSTAFDVANMISDIKMIRLIANITVEQIQHAGPSDAPPPLAIPALSGGRESLRNLMPKENEGVVNGKAVKTEEKEAEDVKVLDLTDLKRKLDKAYRTPTPSISVDDEDNLAKESSVQSRFPMKRTVASSPQRLATPIPSSLSSSVASELSSTSSSLSGRVGVSDPFSDRPPLPHSSPSLLGRKKPPSLFLRNQGTQSLAPKTTPNFRPSSSIATARRASMTSPMQPKLTPKSNSPSLRSKLKGQVPFSYPKMERDLTRRRAETVPASAYRGVAKPKKKISLPRPPPGIDVKSALEMESLGHLYPVFKEQEITMVALLTLTRNDLAELGVRSEDTGRVLSLITKLKLMSSPGHTPGQYTTTPAASPVFTFLP
ncbi:ankyrin repeat and SAM domain-containing protein 6-like [Halichondria panicea]|uniref:ankyrin repeat and SAM domain-containing protein 6-like n=1 Tax=Halichondria panicea TaxID=6063 RepID=UPI00312B8E8F